VKTGLSNRSWVVFPNPTTEAQLRLFCFPYAGGGSQVFRRWADYMPPTVELCPVELPGRGSRIMEPYFTRLPPLIEALAEGIVPYLDRPFAFFGHSMGALISFELARRLRRDAREGPVHLFVSGRGAPQLRLDDPPVHALSESELMERLRELDGTPEEVLSNTELMRLVLPVLRADFAVCETYVYHAEPPLDCSITAFGGLKDGSVPREALEAWREQTRSFFTLYMFPGNHFFLNEDLPMFLHTLCGALNELVNADRYR